MANTYLLVYNTVLSLGWGYVLYLMVHSVYSGGWTREVYEATNVPLKVVQTAAVAEVFHSVLGVVNAPLYTTFIQVLSRMWALWGVVNLAPEATSTGAVTFVRAGPVVLQTSLVTLLFCWCVTEVLRYGFYAAKELGHVPYPLLWARYSLFIVLYPLGVASEMTMAYLALPTIRKERPWSISMPNSMNFAFDYYIFCFIAIACYIPGLPDLYKHMLKQRRKVLAPAGKAKGKAA